MILVRARCQPPPRPAGRSGAATNWSSWVVDRLVRTRADGGRRPPGRSPARPGRSRGRRRRAAVGFTKRLLLESWSCVSSLIDCMRAREQLLVTRSWSNRVAPRSPGACTSPIAGPDRDLRRDLERPSSAPSRGPITPKRTWTLPTPRTTAPWPSLACTADRRRPQARVGPRSGTVGRSGPIVSEERRAVL